MDNETMPNEAPNENALNTPAIMLTWPSWVE